MQYFIDLVNNLKKGIISPVYLFYGPEDYLREQAVNRCKQLLVAPETADFNFDLLEGAEVSEADIAAVASTPPMMGNKRLVVVRRASFFASRKGGVKGTKAKDFSPLLNYIASPLESTCLILETGEPVDRRRKIFKEVAKQGGAIEFLRLRRPELAKWINRLAGRKGKKIFRAGVELLLNRCGTNMFDIFNEMSKLVDFVGEREVIGEEDVSFIVTDRGEESIFTVVDALGTQRYSDALEGIRYLLLRKESPQAITGMLARQVRLILQAGELSADGCSFAETVKRLGTHHFVCKKVLSQSRNFSREELVGLLRGLAQVDTDVKTGRQDFVPAMEMLFARSRVK